MAPWDELTYFDLPVETVVQVSTTLTPVVPADPMRAMIAFSASTGSGGQPPYLTTSTSPSANQGILLGGSIPFILSPHDFLPLVCAAWSGYVNVGVANITVLTVRFGKWPSRQRGDVSLGGLQKQISDLTRWLQRLVAKR